MKESRNDRIRRAVTLFDGTNRPASFFQPQLLTFNEKSKGQLLFDQLYEEKTDSYRKLIVLFTVHTQQIGFLFMDNVFN